MSRRYLLPNVDYPVMPLYVTAMVYILVGSGTVSLIPLNALVSSIHLLWSLSFLLVTSFTTFLVFLVGIDCFLSQVGISGIAFILIYHMACVHYNPRLVNCPSFISHSQISYVEPYPLRVQALFLYVARKSVPVVISQLTSTGLDS